MMMNHGCITDVDGISVGHWSDHEAATGCTTIVLPVGGASGGVYIRGRATGTRGIDALGLRHLVGRADAVFLTGGSAFGLGATDGVVSWLAERGQGFSYGSRVIPTVPTAVIFDLAVADGERWPSAEDARTACEAASTDTVMEGSVGVGTGATVGKVLGVERAMKGGVGTASLHRGDVVVGALVVVNALGDVRDAEGRVVAGARGDDGRPVDAEQVILAREAGPMHSGSNTTIIVVATNARMTRLALKEVARMAGDAFVRRVYPAATAYDGDIIFAFSTDSVGEGSSLEIELLAQRVTSTAILRAVQLARGVHGIPGVADTVSEGRR